jgi:hypothetical protein
MTRRGVDLSSRRSCIMREKRLRLRRSTHDAVSGQLQ